MIGCCLIPLGNCGLKNNSGRITYGMGYVWGMPSLSPLSSLAEPHFNRDTVEFASRERNESNPGIKTLLPFLKPITEESDLENFQGRIVALDACCWLHKAISKSLSRYGDDRRCDLADFISLFTEKRVELAKTASDNPLPVLCNLRYFKKKNNLIKMPVPFSSYIPKLPRNTSKENKLL